MHPRSVSTPIELPLPAVDANDETLLSVDPLGHCCLGRIDRDRGPATEHLVHLHRRSLAPHDRLLSRSLIRLSKRPTSIIWQRTESVSYAYIGTWCMPSRASLLTGHYPHGDRVDADGRQYPGSEYDPEKCPFWPSVFRKHGYQTAQIGKWHTGTDTGYGRDWDYQIVWNRPRHTSNAGNYYKDQMTEFQGGRGSVGRRLHDRQLHRLGDGLPERSGPPGQRKAVVLVALLRCRARTVHAGRPALGRLSRNPRSGARGHLSAASRASRQYMQEIDNWFRGEDGQPH